MNAINRLARIWLVLTLLLAVWSLAPHHSTAQDVEPTPTPEKIDQHWEVIADIDSVQLANELKRLNAAGHIVDKATDLFVVGSKFTIILNDPPAEDAEGR